MSGRLVGEVYDHKRRIHAAGVSATALHALGAIAEGCRDDRVGSTPLSRIADAVLGSERTATRALAELQRAQLVRVVRRGGGRGRSKKCAVYRMADLNQWPTGPFHATDPVDTQMSSQSPDSLDAWVASQSGDANGSRQLTGHLDGESIAGLTGHVSGESIGEVIHRQADPVAKSGPLSRHPGVYQPVLPVTTPGGTTDVTTRRARPPSPAPPPPSEPSPAGVGSLCGQPDCPDPKPCRVCARLRREREDAERVEAAERDYQARQEHLAAQRELTAWLANRSTAPSEVGLDAKREIREILEDAKAHPWHARPSQPSPQHVGRHRAPDPPMPAASGHEPPAPARPSDGAPCAGEDRSGSTAETDPERMVS